MHQVLFYVPALLAAIGVVALAMWQMRRLAARSDEPHAAVRTANLDASTEAGSGWWFGLLSTLPLVAATSWLLAIRWHTIPQRFPIHWGLDGQANGWTDRSFGSVFGPPILAIALVASIALLGELISRSSPGHEGRPVMVRTSRAVLIGCSWFATILLCAMALLPLTHDSTRLVRIMMVGSAVLGLGIVALIAFQSIRMRSVMEAGQNSTDRRFWKAGIFYYNPGDSALMVPKRNGFGYTLNFGRPLCWLLFGVVLLIPIIVLVMIHVSSRH